MEFDLDCFKDKCLASNQLVFNFLPGNLFVYVLVID